MELWRDSLREAVNSPDELSQLLPVDAGTVSRVAERYPLRITRQFLGLLDGPGDPLWKQVVPEEDELREAGMGVPDPLGEEASSPYPNVIHRYSDRVLFLVTSQCAVYCRFCFRKRLVGFPHTVRRSDVERGLAYVGSHPEIREVILSGGDPLVLSDAALEEILRKLRSITHVEVIRVHTRVPGALPQRVTPALCRLLRQFHPLFVNVHFNHPRELAHEAREACMRLADAGIPLGSHTVLLRGVNDDAGVLAELFTELLKCRVRPYYLLQADLAEGTEHFRTRLEAGLTLMQTLRGKISGLAMPQFAVDVPGEEGKVVLSPGAVLERKNGSAVFRGLGDRSYAYPDPVL